MEGSVDENEITPNFDAYLNSQETKFIDSIVENIATTKHTDLVQYGMPLFWTLCLDSSDESKEKKTLALTCLSEMFK